jgi:general secretion pathway protein K
LKSRFDRAPSESSHESGIALVLVLWVLALLTILVITFTGNAQTELRVARNQYDTARARALADAGISLAILGILDPAPETRWRAAGEEHAITYGDGTIRVGVQDEAGKISLNDASDEMLANLFRTLGMNPVESAGLATAIAEWKGMRRSEWAAVNRSGVAGATSEPFLVVEELRLVPGMTRARYDRIFPFVTVYSESDQVDPLTAPAEVLRSLPSVSPQEVDSYLAARTQPGLVPGALPRLAGVSPIFTNPVRRTVTIKSEGRTATGARFVREAVAAMTGIRAQPYHLLSWRQARPEQDAAQGNE